RGEKGFGGAKGGGDIPGAGGGRGSFLRLPDGATGREAPAGIRDQNVYGSESLLDVMTHGFDLGEFGGLRSEGSRAATPALDFSLNRTERLLISAVEHHSRAFSREELGDGCADSPRARRHERYSVFQHVHGSAPSRRRARVEAASHWPACNC